MTADMERGSSEPVKAQSKGRYSYKSPGRVEFMRRLNAEGRGGVGGRRPTHGRRALVELLKRGLDDGSPVVAMQREAEAAYLQDLGGRENATSMDQGLVRRMAILDLDLALLLAQRDGSARLSRNDASQLRQDIARNTAAYSACVKTLGGPGRRTKPADREVIIRRAWDPPAPDPGQGEEAAS